MFHKATYWEHSIFYREPCLLCFQYKVVKSRDVCQNYSFQRAEFQAFLSHSIFIWTTLYTPTPWNGLPSFPHIFKFYPHLHLKWIWLKVFCGPLPSWSPTCIIHLGHVIYFVNYIGSNYSRNIRFLLHTKSWSLLRFEYWKWILSDMHISCYLLNFFANLYFNFANLYFIFGQEAKYHHAVFICPFSKHPNSARIIVAISKSSQLVIFPWREA